jgi:two-component system, NarL family, nitrate/nitrite response regulator NarL
MNILIVDDHPLTCFGLEALLCATQIACAVTVANSATDARKFLERANDFDWIFLDVNIADDAEHALLHDICKTAAIDRSVLISAELDYALVHTALSAGARGFIPKSENPEVFIRHFSAIQNGHIYVPSAFQEGLNEMLKDKQISFDLSPRLLQVQELIVRGASNKVIAQKLAISPHTVKEYVSSLLSRYKVNSRLELILLVTAEQKKTQAAPSGNVA